MVFRGRTSVAGTLRLAHLRRSEIDAIGISLRRLRVRSPRNAVIATAIQRTGLVRYGGYDPIPNLSTAARILIVEANLRPATTWTFDRQTTVPLDYSLFDFFVLSPPTSSFRDRAYVPGG